MLLLFFAAIFCAIGDKLRSQFDTSVFAGLNPKFWNPQVSWYNKWKPGSTSVARFIGSSTFLVFLTDAVHLSRSLMITCIVLAVVIPGWHFTNIWLDLLCLKLIWGTGFELTWHLTTSKKK